MMALPMADMVLHARAALQRGFHIFPCKPREKKPHGGLAPNGVKDATADLALVEKWWQVCPDANPAVALGPSNLTVLDADSGLETIQQAKAWRDRNKLPQTLAVRTGRRTSFGLQLYFRGLSPNRPYFHDGVKGEVRSDGYYVLAPGAVHPVSLEAYTVLHDAAPAPVPELVTRLTKATLPRPTGPIEKAELVGESMRHYYLVERARELHFAGLAEDALVKALEWLYFHRCERDRAKDERVRHGELKDVADWVEKHPVDWRLEPRDFAQLRFLEKRFPTAAAAWASTAADYKEPEHVESALNQIQDSLRTIGCSQDQITRIMKESPLRRSLTHA